MRHARLALAVLAVILAAVLTAVVTAPSAKGATYVGTVLYPLTLAAGFAKVFPDGGGPATRAGLTVGSATLGSAGGVGHAVLWSGPAGQAVDLNPTLLPGVTTSRAVATDGVQQVGGGGSGTAGHALVWSGTAGSAVDLHPTGLPGFVSSTATDVALGRQVGYGFVLTAGGHVAHALAWSGTGASAVDLTPTDLGGVDASIALGTDGGRQVGRWSGPATAGRTHALVWSGTSASAIDLGPTHLPGYTSATAFSTAFAVAGDQQVGAGSTTGSGLDDHALLWTGTAASAVDLMPTDLHGLTASVATGTNGSQQVGTATDSGDHARALLWSGTADSAVDLGGLLPAAGTWTDSYAGTIDAAGTVFGTATGTYGGQAGTFAVAWSAVPEPASVALAAMAGIGLLVRRRHHRLP